MMDEKIVGEMPKVEQEMVTYSGGALSEQQRAVFRLMGRLTERRQEFVRHFASGKSAKESLVLAGYSGSNSGSTAKTLFADENVRALLSLLKEMDGLKYGFPSEWKRAELLDLYGAARDKDQLAVANQVLKSMLEMDGDIKHKELAGSSAVTIKVVKGIDAVLEDDPKTAVIDVTPDSIIWENDPSTCNR